MTKQTYRLKVGLDGKIAIPDGAPGQMVTVSIEEPSQPTTSPDLKRVADMSDDERISFKQQFLGRCGRLRASIGEKAMIDHDSELYADDGLPR